MFFPVTPTSVGNRGNAATDFTLHQNYPNPFNPTTTTITVDVPVGTRHGVSLQVFDVLGREVAMLLNEEKPAGKYDIQFDAANLPSGIYFYRITTNNFTHAKKMILIR
jgi:hypothetical protein